MRALGRGLFGLLVAALGALVGFREVALFAVMAPRRLPHAPVSLDGTTTIEVDVPPRADVEGARVVASWLEPDEAPAATVVMLHGLGDRRTSFLDEARRFVDDGARVLLVDARGHGDSTGSALGYGLVEAGDVEAMLAALDTRVRARGRTLGALRIVGPSYGGAIALATAAHDPRFERVAVLATFRDLETVLPEYGEALFGFRPPPWLVTWTLAEAELRSGIPYRTQSSLDAIRSTHAEVLVAHGTDDSNIVPAHGTALAEACPSRCTLWPREGRTHRTILSDVATWEGVRAFLLAGDVPRGRSGAQNE